MLHLGDSTYEAENRLNEARRVLAARQASGSHTPARTSFWAWLRGAYHRQLAVLGQRLCDLGGTLRTRGTAGSRAHGL
jgi:hypothetical protein